MINLTIHNKCNQFCIFCDTQKMLRDKVWKETTKAEILEQLGNAAKKDTKVNFTGGGEPTMLKELPELIKYAKSLGIEKVCIETNAVLLSYPDYTRKLKESGLDYCIVSLHSHKEDVSDMITQKPGSFKLTIRGLKNLQKEDILIKCVYHTITKFNYKEIKDFIIFIKKNFRVKNFMLSFIRPIESYKKSKSFTPRLSEVRPYLHEALKYCRRNQIDIAVSAWLGVPLCFLEGYEDYSSEFLACINKGKKEHKKQSYRYKKVKGEQCKECKLNFCCSGVPENYANIYGVGELVPLKKYPRKLNKKCKKNTS